MFAAVAFVLALVGLVGLMTLEVAHRAREFSVRLALGAEARHLRNGVLRAATFRGGVGIVLGVVAALAVTRGMRTLLFGVAPTDAATYATVVSIVCAVVLAVSVVPALRAASTNPMEILKRG
jgi:ABC-type antimicrobial peptide transport system permease subunit